jgi:hypothetical protein
MFAPPKGRLGFGVREESTDFLGAATRVRRFQATNNTTVQSRTKPSMLDECPYKSETLTPRTSCIQPPNLDGGVNSGLSIVRYRGPRRAG